jgi:hypothetical protein
VIKLGLRNPKKKMKKKRRSRSLGYGDIDIHRGQSGITDMKSLGVMMASLIITGVVPGCK